MPLFRKLFELAGRNVANSCVKTGRRGLSVINDNILSSGLPDVAIPSVTISDLVFSHCEKYAPFTATECGITGRKYTYTDVIRKSQNFSKSLRKYLKLAEGDVIALLLPNVPEYPLVILGALDAGLIITTLNPAYTTEEIARQLKDSSATAIVTLVELWKNASSARDCLQKQLPILTIKTKHDQSLPRGAIDFKDLADNNADFPLTSRRKPEDVAFLPYSSGTTGLPKGVQLTHRNIVANISQNMSPDLPILKPTTHSFQDVVPTILPMFHIYGFTVHCGFGMCTGIKLVTIPKFVPEDFVAVLRNHKPTVLFVVPPVVLFLAGHPMIKKEDLSSVRVVFSGAAPLGATDEQRLIEKAGKEIYMLQGYGLTETAPTASALSIELKVTKKVYGSIGRLMPNTFAKVINPDDPKGIPLGPHTPGELLLKGPQVMKGYLNRPEETEKSFLDGWLRTGDMAYYDEDGLLFITDRLKELIKVKGFQVPPAELEEIIRSFPSVQDAAVIGVPHQRDGEVPRAYVVPKTNESIDTRSLTEYVKGKVAHYKQLRGGVEVVQSIPKNASGKILRRSLKEQFLKSQVKS